MSQHKKGWYKARLLPDRPYNQRRGIKQSVVTLRKIKTRSLEEGCKVIFLSLGKRI